MNTKKQFAPPWKRQRIKKREEIPTQGQILQMARRYKDTQERALFIFLYLTGARISEVIPTQYLRKHTYEYEETTDKHGLQKMVVTLNENGSPKIINTEKVLLNYEGVKRENLTFETKKGKRILLINIQNRKNKRIIRKNIPIPAEKERELIRLLGEYVKTLDAEDPLFPFGHGKALKIISKSGMNPHYLRDIRLTHLVSIYNFTETKLAKFAGWKDGRPAERYVRLGVHDLIDNY